MNIIVVDEMNKIKNDFKYDKNNMERKFDIPSNPFQNSIIINKNFRTIGVINIDQIMKNNGNVQAFLNRFNIITS